MGIKYFQSTLVATKYISKMYLSTGIVFHYKIEAIRKKTLISCTYSLTSYTLSAWFDSKQSRDIIGWPLTSHHQSTWG